MESVNSIHGSCICDISPKTLYYINKLIFYDVKFGRKNVGGIHALFFNRCFCVQSESEEVRETKRERKDRVRK